MLERKHQRIKIYLVVKLGWLYSISIPDQYKDPRKFIKSPTLELRTNRLKFCYNTLNSTMPAFLKAHLARA